MKKTILFGFGIIAILACSLVSCTEDRRTNSIQFVDCNYCRGTGYIEETKFPFRTIYVDCPICNERYNRLIEINNELSKRRIDDFLISYAEGLARR